MSLGLLRSCHLSLRSVVSLLQDTYNPPSSLLNVNHLVLSKGPPLRKLDLELSIHSKAIGTHSLRPFPFSYPGLDSALRVPTK